jgi:DNA-binding GntR family transcriptional regulator
MVQHGTSQPPSRQLAAILRQQIKSGELKSGDRIPSLVTLSQEHGIAVVTVQKSMKILRDENLIETVAGYGSFVK